MKHDIDKMNIIDEISEKLSKYLEEYATLMSDFERFDKTIRFTLHELDDQIEISKSDIKYYRKNSELFSIDEIIHHEIKTLEYLYHSQSKELLYLLLFLKDENSRIKKKIHTELYKQIHKEKKSNEEIYDYEIYKKKYDDELYGALFYD